jgi:RNA polymerase-binding transcription factor DksA
MKTFKKIITETVSQDYVKCDKCGVETPFAGAIDLWGAVDGVTYCYSCQEKHKVIWFDPKRISGKKKKKK